MLHLCVVQLEGFAAATVCTNFCERCFLRTLDLYGFTVERNAVERCPKNRIFLKLAASRHHDGVMCGFKQAPGHRFMFNAEADCRHCRQIWFEHLSRLDHPQAPWRHIGTSPCYDSAFSSGDAVSAPLFPLICLLFKTYFLHFSQAPC